MASDSRQIRTKGAEEARRQLPALVSEAAEGRVTVITRHGRPVAALVPADFITNNHSQLPIASVAGSGKGLWGKSSSRTIARLRDEWKS